VLAAEAAEFLELQPLRRLLLILVGDVVAVLAIAALQHDIFSRHIFKPSALGHQLSVGVNHQALAPN
jgi:hypothetical protein